MNREHVISDELLDEARFAFSKNEHWIAYNSVPYFLDRGDMYFFKTADEAHEFSESNISEYDNYRVIHAYSIDELLKQMPYGERMEKQLADPDVNGLYNKEGNAFTDALIDNIEQQQILNNKKLSIMNEKNFEYLKNSIRNHGFGETLAPDLEAQLKKGLAEFTLSFKTEVNKRDMEATLYFKKSPDTDMYFFNKYDTRLKNEKDETLAQTFYLNKGWGVTLKEAYNLLNGRAVHKELTDKQDQKYQAWIQLDFGVKDKHGNYERKQYHQNYGYDLKEALSYYPIKEMMKEDDMKSLIRSLEKGNVQMVTLETPGKDVKVFIEANPQYKTITLYNNKMQRMDQDQRQEMMVKPELREGKDKDQSKEKNKDQEMGKEDQPEKKQSKGRRENGNSAAGEENGLVTKKRTSNKKGLGV